ncbi:MAG: GGDEF domain-containing protein [Candidatus Obscuribacterales bacterium]|nr:GGDEF domain-containing protein [Candidatus Obscuribacterales bacterium]
MKETQKLNPGNDHICSGRTCMFCRVAATYEGQQMQQAMLNKQVLTRVQELELKNVIHSSKDLSDIISIEEAERLALMDDLTPLYNARTFLGEFKDEISRAKRYKRALSLCVLNVDNYQDINSQHSHLACDAVLKAVGEVILTCLRDVDIPSRYNEEEFAIMLPETNATGALRVAERLRQRIAKEIIPYKKHQIKVTASVGVATLPGEAKDWEELMIQAVSARCLASERGGNQVGVV